jgi:streptogramin lyase
MKTAILAAFGGAALVLAGCSSVAPTQTTIPFAGAQVAGSSAQHATSSSLTELFNLNYSNGQITVFSIANGKATITKQFTPGGGGAQGFAADAQGRMYTTLTETNSKPCAACVQIYSETGKLVRQLDIPTLKSSPGAPSPNDLSVDAHDNVYVSDYGQQAVYFFAHGKLGKNGPTVVVQNSNNDSGVLSTPNGKNVFVGGDCGFASVRPFTRAAGGKYTSGTCFGIGTLGLIGGAADNEEDVFTPVDGGPGLVSISSPSGQYLFGVPDREGSIGSVALNSDASIAYVADGRNECVYAFARPAKGWLSGVTPKLLTTYKGFKKLNIIAVPQ